MREQMEAVDKILKVFYENPNKQFTVRELSKTANIPRATAHNYLLKLKKWGIITKNNLSAENIVFKTRKICFFMQNITESGLIDYLIAELNPSCIILFGSIRKGESTKDSDIDLFIESHIKKELNLAKFEKKLRHKIQLFIEPGINKLPPHLFNNVINGIKLYGSFKIK